MRLTGLSFKEVLNHSIRRFLLASSVESPRIGTTPLLPAAFPSEFSGASFDRLADELDDEATLRELGG